MEEFFAGQRLNLAGGQLSFDGFADLRVGQAPGNAQCDRLPNTLACHVLQSHPANHGRPIAHHHAAGRTLPKHAFAFQIGICALDDLGIGQELLGKRAKLCQQGP